MNRTVVDRSGVGTIVISVGGSISVDLRFCVGYRCDDEVASVTNDLSGAGGCGGCIGTAIEARACGR